MRTILPALSPPTDHPLDVPRLADLLPDRTAHAAPAWTVGTNIDAGPSTARVTYLGRVRTRTVRGVRCTVRPVVVDTYALTGDRVTASRAGAVEVDGELVDPALAREFLPDLANGQTYLIGAGWIGARYGRRLSADQTAALAELDQAMGSAR